MKNCKNCNGFVIVEGLFNYEINYVSECIKGIDAEDDYSRIFKVQSVTELQKLATIAPEYIGDFIEAVVDAVCYDQEVVFDSYYINFYASNPKKADFGIEVTIVDEYEGKDADFTWQIVNYNYSRKFPQFIYCD